MARKKKGFSDPSPDKLYDQAITFMVDGKEWRMNRIKIDDISAVYGRIRDNRVAVLVRYQREMLSHIAAEAFAHAAAIDPTQEDYWNYANTPAGLIYIIFRCMAPLNPGLTEQAVADLVEKEGGLKDMLFAESGISEPEPPPSSVSPEGENSPPLKVFGGPDLNPDGSPQKA